MRDALRGVPSIRISTEAMVAAAADPRLTLPDEAFEVPSNEAAASVLSDHFPSWRADPPPSPADQPGYAWAWGSSDAPGSA